ncbi:YybH family protein [Aestuariibaculum sediminum]|uniref:DUF4440 domain-containing protein n=1 Tax=Aestuariibaculum sediminum TaxID=2770637 RepID=A0A8J6Q2X9_9FLAO|nr:DUF4440 domain-containing protein [Aestuariibaculum sediminum]MBD0832766.1 DUF4440 domain-containing protein [Aestuariibaculum sediminum]
MKYVLFLILVGINFQACKQQEPLKDKSVTKKIDIEAELKSIEQTRHGFEQAIKEKRYSDLKQYATHDMKGVSPGSEDWLEYKRIREKPMGQFSYDSIIMRPQETVIVSDSVAYDFGTSNVYYTNANGEPIELEDTFLVILKKDKTDGKWKLHREVASAVVE